MANDPSGHCPLCLTAVIGAAVGAIVGAVGYTAYTVATGNDFNTGHMLMAAGGGAVAGALIGTGVGIAAGLSAAAETSTLVAAGEISGTAKIVADENPTELAKAISVGQTAIEDVTSAGKISSQLQTKSGILGINVSGDMGDLSNPEVQNGLSRLNNISSSASSRIWSGTFKQTPVFEYINEGIGVIRDQDSGSMISVFQREGASLQKLQDFVDNGTAKWLR